MRRRTAIGAAIAVVLARIAWTLLTRDHVAYVDYDTQVFEQIAAHPLGFDLVGYPKPLLVPLVYRAVGSDRAMLLAIQENLAFVAWAALTASLARAMRHRWLRAAAIAVGLAFLFAPPRVGYTGALMSESIADSLFALIAACAIGLAWLPRGRARRGTTIALGIFGLLWVLTRDSNVVIVVVAAALAMLVWRGWRDRRAWIACALVAGIAAFAVWSTKREHPPLPYQSTWDVRFTPRAGYPLLDNMIARAHDEIPPSLAPLAVSFDQVWRLLDAKPELRPLQDWILDEGSGAYLRWLVRDPLARAAELVDARWVILANPNSNYMPGGWQRGSWLRRLTLSHALLLALMAAAPFALWRPRADRLRALALCMLLSGLAGAVAAFYGDAAEVARHSYGAGQQIVLALFVAALAKLDQKAVARTIDGQNAPSNEPSSVTVSVAAAR